MRLALLVALQLLFFPGVVNPAESEKSERAEPVRAEPKSGISNAESATPIYRPPMRGAPGGRVGGATRGTGRSLFVLSALAPDHTGLTLDEQPALYWYLTTTVSSPIEVTLLDPRVAAPLLQLRIPPPIRAGVHGLQLTDHNVRLEPGVGYRWFVAVIADQKRRSKDVLAGGAIERVTPTAELGDKLTKASGLDAVSIYADAGVWYDALAALMRLIAASPKDAVLLRQRAALLTQVGLPDIGD